MNVIVCLDNDNGMLFNNRRQSRDKKVIEKIRDITSGRQLWINEFSANLFDFDVTKSDCMLSLARDGDFCFIENLHLEKFIDSIEKMYVFKWNRDYPADFKLDINIETLFSLKECEDFEGYSHDKITMEVWVKCQD